MLIPTLPSPLPVQELKAAGIHDILGVVKVEDFTYFHNLVYSDEMARSGLSGPSGSLTTGMAFGVPCLIKFGSRMLKDKYLADMFHGKTRACIAITGKHANRLKAHNLETTLSRLIRAGRWIRCREHKDRGEEERRRQEIHHQRRQEVDYQRCMGGLRRHGCTNRRTWCCWLVHDLGAVERTPRSRYASVEGQRTDLGRNNLH